jgi:hypothetical protein
VEGHARVFRGLLVLHDTGKPIYTFYRGEKAIDGEVLLPGFVAAIQSFAAEMLDSEQHGSIHSIKLAQSLILTFRPLNLQVGKGDAARFYFVLLSDLEGKQAISPEAVLEYLILSFLGFERGLFLQKLRQGTPDIGRFQDFDSFLTEMSSQNWATVCKKTKPIPASLIQGLLNELRDYIPLSRILELHPKIVPLGSSYAWLSDDLPKSEEEQLMTRIEHLTSRLFGHALYDALVAKVTRKLNRPKFHFGTRT